MLVLAGVLIRLLIVLLVAEWVFFLLRIPSVAVSNILLSPGFWRTERICSIILLIVCGILLLVLGAILVVLLVLTVSLVLLLVIALILLLLTVALVLMRPSYFLFLLLLLLLCVQFCLLLCLLFLQSLHLLFFGLLLFNIRAEWILLFSQLSFRCLSLVGLRWLLRYSTEGIKWRLRLCLRLRLLGGSTRFISFHGAEWICAWHSLSLELVSHVHLETLILLLILAVEGEEIILLLLLLLTRALRRLCSEDVL